MQITDNKYRDIQIPVFENCDWIDASFSNWPDSIRQFREILYEKGWNGKVGLFEAEIAVDLKVLNNYIGQNAADQPVDALIGYKHACAFFVFVDLASSNANRFAGRLKSLIDYSRCLVEKVDNQMDICGTTVVLLGDKYFNFNEHIIRRHNPNDVFTLLPMTVEDFYKRVFMAGYERMSCQ